MNKLEQEERWTIFGVVAFTVWSDGRLAAAEVTVARAIAEQFGLPLDKAGARLREGAGELGDLELSPNGRAVAYAAATWAALADGIEHPAERAVLRTLGYRLGIEPERATEIEAQAYVCSLDRSGPTAHARFDALVRAVETPQTEGASRWEAAQ